MAARIGKREAEVEALRLANGFVAASLSVDSPWLWECGPAHPCPGLNGRKNFLKWTVSVRWIPKGGGVVDGGSPGVLVDLETNQASFL